ncbi:MAG TPA: alpha-2-macroglobulin [Planctomycetota bacterium]|nr:alpha-2-macroglobulin [Planctomycetota bacterium]
MRAILAKRWVWITALFATINIVGLVVIASQLRHRTAALRIEAFRPEGETDPAAEVTIRFNQLMVASEEVGKEAEGGLVLFSPAVEGRLTWADRMTLSFRPAAKLPMATPFAATLSRKCTSLLGHSLLADATFPFHTPALKVEAVRQTALSRYSEVRLALEFNAKVTPDEARQHIVLSSASGRSVPYSLGSHTPSRTVMLTTRPFPEETLRVTVKKGLRGPAGPLGLEAPWTCQLPIEMGLKIHGLAAVARTPDDVRVTVSCNQPLDLDAAPRHIQVEPQVALKVLPNYDGFQLLGAFVPTRRYKLTFQKGLAARNGAALGKDVVRSIVIPEVQASMHFRTQGIYLGAQSSMVLPLECVNVRRVDLSITQVYPNNVVHYLRDSDRRSVGELCRHVHEEKLTLPQRPNERQVRELDLRKLLGADARGAYIVTAFTPDVRWGDREEQLILVSDLGLSVKRSDTDLLVWVNTLSTVQPVEGASVAVFSRASQQLLSGTTDAGGIAHFKGVDWSSGRQPFVVAATKGNDTGVLELDAGQLDDSELDAGGRPYLAAGYEAFVYSDRGIYRPGSEVRLHALVRGKDLAVPKPFPVQFRIQRPDGRLFKTLAAKLSQWGSAGTTVEVPSHALTGRYTVEVRLPGDKAAIGSHTFQVEEFMPDRMKVTLTAKEQRWKAGDEVAVAVKATHLFGSPAADRQVEARCEFIASTFTHPQLPDFHFADSARKLVAAPTKLAEETLDKNGECVLTVRVPKGLLPPSAVTAVVTASVKELGGRAVSASLAFDVDCYPHYIGLARASKEYARAGVPEKLLVAAVKPDGAAVGRLALEGTVCRVIWNTVLRLQDSSYRFVSEREEKTVEQLSCTIADGRGEVDFAPKDIGEYIVRLQDKASGASADLRFYCSGEGDAPWTLEKPARVELVADKAAYAPGDTARILIKAPFPGKALLTVETDRIHLAQALTLEGNTAEFRFPVTAALAPNAYCSATVIRTTAPGSRWAVQRAYGAVPILLDCKPRQLKVEVVAPEETRPGKPLRVALRVRDAAGAGQKAEVTLAAVDEGICQLTRFRTPDPWGFFFAKRSLGVAASDIYARLMPEPERKKAGTDSAPGGDGGEEDFDPRLLNPVGVQRVKQVALWKAGIETDADGAAEVVLDVPAFTGQLRIMAVAASASDFGACERPAHVKQPLMVQTSFPRFLAPGDQFTVPVTVFNNTGKGGTVQLAAEGTGGMVILSDAPSAVEVEHGREKTVSFTVQAPLVPGPAAITVRARLGGETAEEKVDIPVRPPATLQFASGSGTVKAGQTARFTVPGDWLKGTDRYWLSFSPLPTLKLGSSLRYLLRYPYGCIEQTTSTVFPLLYLGDVAKVVEPDLDGKEIESLVQAGIDRVFSMQTYSGGFGFWPGYGEVYPWGSIYATHFLVEAAKAGYDIPKDNLDSALGYLDGLLTEDDAAEAPPPAKAYACLVLAAAGKPNRSWTLRLAERSDELPAYSRFHAAAALAAIKEDKLAGQLLAAATLPPVAKARDTGDLLHSSAREAAILLSVYLDLQPDHPSVPLLVQRLADAMRDGRWATTQENAFALMALGKYARRLAAEKSDFKAEVTAGGERLASLTSGDSVLLKPKDLGGREVQVATQGAGTLYYYWGAEGIPTKETAVERDTSLKVRRRFLSRDGGELDLKSVKQGEIVIVELTLDNGVPVKNLVVNDLLPAGFEIENPRLATSEQVDVAAVQHAREVTPAMMRHAPGTEEDDAPPPPANGAAKPRPRPLNPDRVEMRDDRLILFADLDSSGLWRHCYVVRAVTCGRFRLPALDAFCMYNPEICSVHGAGTVEITGR